MNAYHRQQAYILITVVVTLFIIAAIALLLNRESAMGVNMAVGESQDIQARYVAEAGLNHALWQSNNSNCTAYPNPLIANFGAHSYTVAVLPTSGSPVTVSAVGALMSGATRTITRDSVKIYQAPIPETLRLGSLAGKDTFISLDQPDKNFGNDSNFELEGDAETHVLLEFDLASLPPDAIVDSATLEIYLVSISGAPSPATISAHRITNSWDEQTVTWDKYDGINPWSMPGGSHDANLINSITIDVPEDSWRQLDVTSVAADWVSGAFPNYGILLKINGPFSTGVFVSKEDNDVALRPKLTITYVCECGVFCTASPAPSGYYRDEFNSRSCDAAVDYIGSDGTLDWSGFQWQENDNGDPCSGNVWLLDNQSSNRLALNGSGGWISRKVDLSSFSGATLSFDYLQFGNFESNKYLSIEVSGDNGSNWTELGRIDVTGDEVTYQTASYDIPFALVTLDSVIRFRAEGLQLSREIYLDNVNIVEGTAPPVCPADFVPDTRESEFDIGGLGISDPWGITFLPPGTTFKGVTTAAEGAWLLVDGSNRNFIMTDMSGVELVSSAIPASEPRGIAFIPSGIWKDHLALANPGSKQIFFIDLNATNKGSFSTNSFTEHPVGVTFIENSASGTYEGHLAISADKDGGGSSNAGLYIVDQSGVLKASMNISGFATEPWGIAHIPGKDKFLVVDKSGTAYIVGFDGVLHNQYSTAAFGAIQPQSIAINPQTSAHAVLDKDSNKVMFLTSSTCGGGGGPGSGSIITLIAEADSYNKADKLFENNGDRDSLFLQAGSKGTRGVLRYDVSSLAAGTLIQNAVLRLYVSGNSKTHVIQAFTLTEAWDESAVSWNDRTAGVAWTVAGGKYTTPAVAGVVVPGTLNKDWIELDVTALVQEWVDGVSANLGVILLTDQTKEIKLASRESTDTSFRPQLVIDYTAP